MHPTELVQYGISTEGHQLADRPLLEINERAIAQWTEPPPPPSDAEKYATERNELPRGFDKWAGGGPGGFAAPITRATRTIHPAFFYSIERRRLFTRHTRHDPLFQASSHQSLSRMNHVLYLRIYFLFYFILLYFTFFFLSLFYFSFSKPPVM